MSKILRLQKGNPVPKNSTILSFWSNIYWQIVACSWLKSTELSLKCHSQIIIDKNHPLAGLFIKYHHEINLHSGREQTLSTIRKKYWITTCRRLIQRVLKSCSYCKQRSAKPQQPFMSSIPIQIVVFAKWAIEKPKCTVSGSICDILVVCVLNCYKKGKP